MAEIIFGGFSNLGYSLKDSFANKDDSLIFSDFYKLVGYFMDNYVLNVFHKSKETIRAKFYGDISSGKRQVLEGLVGIYNGYILS